MAETSSQLLFDPLGAAVSAFGSILGYKTAKKNRQAQERMNQANIEMQRETNAQQYHMFQEGNQFNRQQALEMFNLENEYNTPEANKQRMLEAGLNPFADSGAVQPMQANTSPASSVSPPTLTAPHGVAPQMDSSFIRDFGNVAQAMHALVSAKKEGVETRQLELTLEPRLKGMYLENDGKEITNKLNKVALDVQEEFAKPKAQAELANILESTQKLVSDVLLNYTYKSTSDALSYLYNRQADLVYSSKLLTDKQKELLEKELNNYDFRFALESALTKAQTYNQNAQGKEALASADVLKQEERAKIFENYITSENIDNLVDQVGQTLKFTKEQIRDVQENARIAKRTGNWMWFDKTIGRILGNVGAIAMASILRSPAMSGATKAGAAVGTSSVYSTPVPSYPLVP